MLHHLIKIKAVLFDILFPPLCINCAKFMEENAGVICNDCFGLITINNSTYCPICLARLADNKKICHHGKEEARKFPYLLAPASDYANPAVKNLIHSLKYRGMESAALILSDLILKYFENCSLKIENYSVVPVPLFFWKEKRRGFNQSALIARYLANSLNLEMKDVLIRVKHTPSQAKINKKRVREKLQTFILGPSPKINSYEKRQKNVLGAFKMIDRENILDKNIILVDDVYTSGATAGECARVLKENGAKSIIVVAAAKA